MAADVFLRSHAMPTILKNLTFHQTASNSFQCYSFGFGSMFSLMKSILRPLRIHRPVNSLCRNHGRDSRRRNKIIEKYKSLITHSNRTVYWLLRVIRTKNVWPCQLQANSSLHLFIQTWFISHCLIEKYFVPINHIRPAGWHTPV